MQKLKEPLVIIGLGKTGLSCARFLLENNYRIQVMDTRSSPPCLTEIQKILNTEQIFLNGLNAEILLNAGTLVVSPGISIQTPEIVKAKASGVEIIGDVEIFSRFLQQKAHKKIIAITGSNGKSTVTDMMNFVLNRAGFKAQMCGNIGIPVLEVIQKQVEYYVLELSSFQLETTHSLNAEVGCILNITPDHMDRYDSLADYENAKLCLLKQSKSAVLPYANSWEVPESIDVVDFGVYSLAKVYVGPYQNQNWLYVNGTPWIDCGQLHIYGQHNWLNVLAVIGMLIQLNIELTQTIKQAIMDYQGLAHRCQFITKSQGIVWINDSKATNVASTEAAIFSFQLEYKKRLVLIAGGDSKEADLSPLKPLMNENLAGLIVLGMDAQKLVDLMEDKEKTLKVKNLQEAVVHAHKFLPEGGMVLLSPACSSLDMFKNFEDRGEQFCKTVRELYA